MRDQIVAANWKMNLYKDQALTLFEELKTGLSSTKKKVIIFPPSIYLADLLAINEEIFDIGAQNFYYEPKGPFTGEISADQLTQLGCTYVLVGHSERREIFGEKDSLLLKKIKAALTAGLGVVYCIGESLNERESGAHKEKIQQQIELLSSVSPSEMANISIAYEPIWAIGTGLTASPDQAEEMHAFIRGTIQSLFSEETASALSILYGGSCNEQNAKQLFSCPNIDGGLIGGASLKASSFTQIADS